METRYRLNRFAYAHKPLIERVEIDRETDKFVVIGGQRRAKLDRYEGYFMTWAEAHAELLNRTVRAYENALSAIDRAKNELDEAQAMTEPKP